MTIVIFSLILASLQASINLNLTAFSDIAYGVSANVGTSGSAYNFIFDTMTDVNSIISTLGLLALRAKGSANPLPTMPAMEHAHPLTIIFTLHHLLAL
jgi:hypothetical protein